MFAKAPQRGIIPANLLLALLLSLVPVSHARAQTAPSGNASGVPKVKASDHQGLAIGADTEKYVKELPSGALVDRNLANGTGYTGYQIDDMAKLAKDENVIIGARSTNVESMRHLRDGKAVPKPVEIKSKTITELDTYLGAKPEDKGLVGYFQPKQPIESEVPKHLWEDVQKRHIDRVKEYEELRGSVDDLQRTGKVVEKDGKLFAVAQNADGSPSIKPDGSTDIKPFAGDIDAVYFKDATTGKYIPPGERYDDLKRKWMGLPDQPEPKSFLERFKRAWSGDEGASDYWTKSGAPGQHGAEANLVSDLTKGLQEGTPEYEKALKKARELHESLAENHWKKGEVVMEMRPDGHLRRGTRFTKNTPLPDLHSTGAATKAVGVAGDVSGTAKAIGAADDILDVAGKGSRIAKTASKAIGAALDKLATLGNIADRVEAAVALLKLKNIYDTYAKAWDPATSDAEAAELLNKAQEMAREVGGDASIFVLLETVPLRFPGLIGTGLPIAYLAWSLKCLHRDWGQEEATCTEDHYNALVRAWDTLLGDKLERDAQRAADAKAQCDAFKRAVADGRAKPKWPFTEKDVCDAIKQGWTTTDMRDDGGSQMAGRCGGVERRIGAATAFAEQGKLNDAQALLARAKHWLGEFGAQSCPGLADRVAGQLDDIEKAIAPLKANAETALSQCRFGESLPLIGALPALQREALMERWNKASDAESEAKALLAQALAEETAGNGAAALENLRKAKDLSPCEATLAAIDSKLGRPELVAQLDQAMADLDAARDRYEQRIAQDAPNCRRAAEATMPDGPNSIAGHAKRIEEEKDRFLTRLWPDRDRHQDAYNNFRSMTDALKRVVGQTVAAADLACARLSGAAPSLANGKDSVLRTRNLGVLADGIAAQALGDADKLIEQLNDSRYESGSDRRAMISSIYSAADNFRSFCGGLPRPNDAFMDGDIPRVEETAITLVRMAESDGSGVSAELAATYRGRYQNHIRERNAIGRRSMCGTDRQAAIDACHRNMSRIADMIPEAAEKFDQVVTARTGAVERVKTDQEDIASLVKQRRDAEALAKQCLADAENNQPPRSGGKVVLLPPVPPPPVTVTPPPPGPGPLPGPTGPLGPTGPGPTGPTPGPTGPTTGPTPVTGPSPGASPGPTQDKTKAGADCDPNKVAKAKPDNTKGFVPVPYKGATAWTGATNPDCPPFGPAAKGVDDGLATKDAKPATAPVAQTCRQADAAIERGREHYLAGRVTQYRVALVNAEREIRKVKDSKACPDQRAKIAKGGGQADLLERVIKSADQALKSCDETNLRKLSGLLSKTNHPHVAKLRERADRMAMVASQVGQADSARTAGRTDGANRLYRLAAAELNAAPGACPNLAQRVRDGQQRVKVTALAYTPALTGLATATNDCKAKYGSRGMAVPNPDSVTGYTCDCADPYRLEGGACVREKSAHERADAAHGACRESYGGSAYAQPKDATYKEYGCLCGKGHSWNENRTQCVQQTQEQVIADANRRCQEANKNKRARAGKYLGNEQWTCVIDRSRSEIMADAHRSCQRANGNDRRVRAGKQLANGQWSCHIPGPRRVVTQHQQSQPNYDAAAAAATAAAVMQGLGSLMRTQTMRPPTHGRVPYSSCQLDINRPLSQTCPSAGRR